MVTPGNETDFDEIERDVRELCSRFQVVSVGYDPWQSTQVSQRLRAEGVPCTSSGRRRRTSAPRSSNSMQRCGPAGSGTTVTQCSHGASPAEVRGPMAGLRHLAHP